MHVERAIEDLQKKIFEVKGIRTDVHIMEDKGALFIPEFASLHPNNVIISVPYMMFLMGNINIQF